MLSNETTWVQWSLTRAYLDALDYPHSKRYLTYLARLLRLAILRGIRADLFTE